MKRTRGRQHCFREHLESRHCLSTIAFVPQHDDVIQAEIAIVADLDDDRRADLIIVNDGDISWHRRVNRGEDYGNRRSIGPVVGRVRTIEAHDIDGDGDLDVVAATSQGISWFENAEGRGQFASQHVVDDETNVFDIAVDDLDGDGDLDIVWSSYHLNPRPPHGAIGWYRNTDGFGSFIEERRIATRVGVVGLHLADLDGDSDVDLVATRETGLSPVFVTWYEQTDQDNTTFQPRELLTESFGGESRAITTADIDGDSDLDIISTGQGSNECLCSSVVWHENALGDGEFKQPTVIESGMTFNVFTTATQLNATDLDRDGDPDLVVHTDVDDRRIHWYNNVDSGGEFEHRELEASAVLGVADVDGDGDPDIVASEDGGNVMWFENRVIGDSNDDGVFSTSDLVAIFAAGTFEDGVRNNGSFDVGDWNQDGEFNTSDLVFALQAGTFQSSVP